MLLWLRSDARPATLAPSRQGFSWVEREVPGSGRRSRKKAASGTAMVGTTRARSSQSLRCSQLVSAISFDLDSPKGTWPIGSSSFAATA